MINNKRKYVFRFMAGIVVYCLAMPLWAGELTLATPPESLSQWYKPQNKRQVWLHNMFSLRRSMQAIEEYLERNDAAMMQKWASEFDGHYRKIGEMVPEWQGELETEWSAKMVQATNMGDREGVRRALVKLQTSCRSCHNEYRTVASILYRGPDFSSMSLDDQNGGQLQFSELMEQLSNRVNRVKIFQQGDDGEAAKSAAEDLKRLLSVADNSCLQCHKENADEPQRFTTQSGKYLSDLVAAVEQGNEKQTNNALGSIGAFVCARCHSTHRPLAEMRALLEKRNKEE